LFLEAAGNGYGTSSTPNLIVGGRIGLGTSTPGAKLSFSDLTSDNTDGITWYNPDPTRYGIFRSAGSWDAPDYQQLQFNWETGIILNPGNAYGKSYVDVQGGGLRVSSGTIGIGTLAPAHKLDVNGVIGINGKPVINTAASDGNDIYINSRVIRNESTTSLDGMYVNYNSTGAEGAHLRFYANGDNERMRIDAASGAVGIGTATPNPAYKLDVAGTINATSILVNGQPVSGGSSAWVNVGTDINFLTGSVGIGKAPAAGNKLDVSGAVNATSYKVNGTALVGSQWAASGTNLFYNSTNNVGIGTGTASTLTSAKLNVYKSGAATSVLIGSPTTTSGNFTSLVLGTSADKNGFTFINSIKSAAATAVLGDLVLNQNGGNVGIGVSPNAAYKLDVNGTINAKGLLVNGVDLATGSSIWSRTGNSIVAQGSSAGSFTLNLQTVTAGDAILALSSNTGGSAIIKASKYGTEAKPLVFQTNDAEKMRIDGLGNVGIGTTIPDAKLTVKGTVHANEVKVDLNVQGPDYVFEKGYDLMSLEETKAYIEANKHLPEVPSAKEMEKNGVQLGEMNLLLLKKVEELTLHLIEQNKKLEIQQQEINQLKGQLKR
jgi:hypothetical protein